jgi:hypothetical protein
MAKAGSRFLDRHRPDFLLHLSGVDHGDRVPGTAIQKTPIRPFTNAFLAADAQNGIHLDPSKGRIIFVRYPEHAIFDRAIFHACRGAGAPCAALGDNRQFFRFLFAGCGEAFGLRFKLQLVRNHPDGLGSSRCSRHAGIIAQNCPSDRLEIQFHGFLQRPSRFVLHRAMLEILPWLMAGLKGTWLD